MSIICSWCLKVLGEKEPKENKYISHSICDKCKEIMLKSIKK